MKKPENPLRFDSRDEWRAWLVENHASSKDAWLAMRKGKVKQPVLKLAEAVEEALCFGWVDSILMSLDESEYALCFTPRKRGSNWSQINKDRAARLTEEGRMAAAGLAAIQAAREEGGWDRLGPYDPDAKLPDEMQAFLEANPLLKAQYAGLPPSQRQGLLAWILMPKSSSARSNRISKLAGILAQIARKP